MPRPSATCLRSCMGTLLVSSRLFLSRLSGWPGVALMGGFSSGYDGIYG